MADLRPLVFVDEASVALSLTRGAARKWMASGRLGRPHRVGRRLAVLRSEFMDSIRQFEIPASAPRRRTPPELRVDAEIEAALEGRGRRNGRCRKARSPPKKNA